MMDKEHIYEQIEDTLVKTNNITWCHILKGHTQILFEQVEDTSDVVRGFVWLEKDNKRIMRWECGSLRQGLLANGKTEWQDMIIRRNDIATGSERLV